MPHQIETPRLERSNHQRFPQTRYLGSKQRLLDWLWSCVRGVDFETVLDLFSGSAAVSYMFRTKGKSVTTNDYLRSNAIVARALVVNDGEILPEARARTLFKRKQGREYDDSISRTFHGVFFLDEENEWLDTVAQNLADWPPSYTRDLAYFALFQACLAKRPYNLFHRANLYMRTSEIKRSFGNKTTWDRPFEEHFMRNLRLANAAVFSNGREHRALCGRACDLPPAHYDLVYIDPHTSTHEGSASTT